MQLVEEIGETTVKFLHMFTVVTVLIFHTFTVVVLIFLIFTFPVFSIYFPVTITVI